MERDRCEFADNCPMFAYFDRFSETVYRLAYCEGNYTACERRKIRLAGQDVPINMLPQGNKLWADGAQPPAEFHLPGA